MISAWFNLLTVVVQIERNKEPKLKVLYTVIWVYNFGSLLNYCFRRKRCRFYLCGTNSKCPNEDPSVCSIPIFTLCHRRYIHVVWRFISNDHHHTPQVNIKPKVIGAYIPKQKRRKKHFSNSVDTRFNTFMLISVWSYLLEK